MTETWTCDDVISWLTKKKLTFWAKEFSQCRDEGLEIDGLTLMEIDEQSLYEDFPNSRALCRKTLVAKIGNVEKDIPFMNASLTPPRSPMNPPSAAAALPPASPLQKPAASLSENGEQGEDAIIAKVSLEESAAPQAKDDIKSPNKKTPMAPPPFVSDTMRRARRPKRPSLVRWESILNQTPTVDIAGSPIPPPPPISMIQRQQQPSRRDIYRQMSIKELKRIEPASVKAFTDEFKQTAIAGGLFALDEDTIVAPPPPIDINTKPKAGPAPLEKIRQLQNQMSFRVPMLSPRTAVHFHALPPEYDEELLNKMSTERTGEELDSAQTILGLHVVISAPGEAVYRFNSQKGVDLVHKPKPTDVVKVMKKELSRVRVPHVKIEGTWISDLLDDDANLLGGSHKFEVDDIPVNLPIVDADEEILAFFGCKLIRQGDLVTFPELTRPFPVFCLQIGEKYMENYILERELGGGVFLEYHDDNPHFHAPLSRRSGGYLLLGVPSDDRRGKAPLPKRPDPTQRVTLKVAGIRVPYGCAVYTPPGVLHADSACTGRWLIGYDQSTDFSTVLFRSKDDKVVHMEEINITM